MNGQPADLRVLHVVASNDRRGAEVAAVELCEALAPLGCAGPVAALAPGTIAGLEVAILGPTRFAPTTLKALRGAVAEHDIVIAHGSSTLPAVAAATLGTATPFVYRSIGDPTAWVSTRARRMRVSAAARRAAAVVALWRGAAVSWHEAIGIRAEQIEVIPNGVRADRFPAPTAVERSRARSDLGLPADMPVALYLGSLSAEKRVDLAIRAAAAVPGLALLVVGDGPERSALEAASGADGATVRFLGATPDPRPALTAADVVVLASDTEGQPAVLIEAGLSCRPVVATRVGGVGEMVLDGGTGLLVPPGDVAGLAAGILTALGRRGEMGEAGREHCLARFDLARIAPVWAGLLRSKVRKF